jgi:hypothetical protein
MLSRTTDRTLVAALAVAAVIFLALEYLSRSTLERLTIEDGPIEYLTALVFLVAGVLFIVSAVRRSASRIWALLLGVGSIFIAGEEISWGQRLLGLATPESLAESNVQSEINLHNLEGVHGIVRGAGVLVLLTVFVAFPIAVARLRWARDLADRWRIPVPPLAAIPVLGIGLLFMIVPRLVEGGAVFRFDEVGEIYVAIVMLMFATRVWRTSARRAEVAAVR